MRRALGFVLALWAAAVGLGCGERKQVQPPAPAAAPAPKPAAPAEISATHPVVALDVAGQGRIRIELLPEKAPRTVANFIALANKGFYDGTTFHRVVPGFMIQGGDLNSKNRDPRDDGQGDPGFTIPDETNDMKHVRGVLSMANRGSPDTAGSQFFIVVADQPDLDGHYTAFGRVIEGMEVVDRIAAVETDKYGRYGAPDRPRADVVVRTARVEASEGGTPRAAGESTSGKRLGSSPSR
jgi:peptidyl-prolyl cis-trans isomerase B (cyclophilin B)